MTLINQYRIQNGRLPLALNAPLSAAADWMSGDMGARAYLGHVDSVGRYPGDRARDYGYTGAVGENIAAGVSLGDAQAVFDAWRSSAGHNANMLGATYRVIGIGRASVSGSPYGLYWTADFGESANPPGAEAVSTCGGAVALSGQSTVVGDADCDSRVRSPDALAVLRLVAVLAVQPSCRAVADVNCDGQVTSVDALAILAYVSGIQRQGKANCPAIASTS